MSKSADPQRLAQVQLLTAELRSLQSQLNRTVDQLCTLVQGRDLLSALPGDGLREGEVIDVTHAPSFMQLPLREPFLRDPVSGQSVGPDSVFYTDNKAGLLHLVQQPLPRDADSAYSLIINFSDFDGGWLSLVMDLRGLLKGLPSGRARLGLVIEAKGAADSRILAKCSWSTADWREERPLDITLNKVCASSAEIPWLDVEKTTGLDLHLVLNPAPRGSVELRRISLSLTVFPAKPESPALASVFENAP